MYPVFISVRVCTNALVDSPLPAAAIGGIGQLPKLLLGSACVADRRCEHR
jgi:hypothetical protein